jgi:hypothetical protein
MSSAKLTVEQFIKSRVRDREAMRQAARHMDELRKRCGKPEKGFNSVEVLRKIREAR